MPRALALGAPGIYHVPAQASRAPAAVRMDVCAFVGVASRGPARVPVPDETSRGRVPWLEPECPRRRSRAVPIENWAAFCRLYGEDGPGYLPRAVEAFFRQGGRRAYVVRIVHDYGEPEPEAFDPVAASAGTDQKRNDAGIAVGRAAGVVTAGGDEVRLVARDEGAWGNRLRAAMRYQAAPLRFNSATTEALVFPHGTPLSAGMLLRLTVEAGVRVLRAALPPYEEWDPESGERRLVVRLETPVAFAPRKAEVVEGVLTVDDGDGRSETHAGLGLSSEHPRWAALVLCRDSALVWPTRDWRDDALRPLDVDLRPPDVAPGVPGSAADPFRFAGGANRYADIVPEDFFDPRYAANDDEPYDGVHTVAGISEVALMCAPDLYHPEPAPKNQAILTVASQDGAAFTPCVTAVPVSAQAQLEPGLDGLLLDPRLAADLARIAELQGQLVELAEERHEFVVLLDVPPGLRPRQILDWRAHFDSAFAAAYHPWVRMAPGGPDDVLPPSALAAGLIAKREIVYGLPHGPANELAVDAVTLHEPVPRVLHDELHPVGVNVFQRERDGVRLTGARTLSRERDWRQLSVRRLMTYLKRLLEREMQWIVFEPNTTALRGEVRQMLNIYLRRLYLQGAFKGASEEEAFFVRCDDELNPQRLVDLGRFHCVVGVAPAEPMEFLVLRIARDHEGTLTVEA